MQLGVLLTAYNCEETLEACLEPWRGHRVAAVSIPFKEYGVEKNNEATLKILKNHCEFIAREPKFVEESVARNLALSHLKAQKLDSFIILDGDEIYSKEDISKLESFVESQSDICWFSVNLKNYVFTEETWIDGFCPPRVFRFNYGGLMLDSFYWDNDIYYKDISNRNHNYKNISNIAIPKRICYPKHLTWLNNEKSKEKVRYQEKHFGQCSYRWNEESNQLEFNTQYYSSLNLPVPALHKDLR